MKLALCLTLGLSALAGAAAAQDFGLSGDRQFSVDLGLGVVGKSTYPGADDAEAQPWIIWKNASFGGTAKEGLSFGGSFGMVGSRDEDDDDALIGMEEVDRAYEIGGKVSYRRGPVNSYVTLRRGFGGHEGLTGEVGAKYRTELSDRVTLWSGLELGYGDDEYNDAYFGVSSDEATAGRAAYSAGGGFNKAAITFEARYDLTENLAVLGEVEYGKLIGDAADSPIVQDEYQPALRLGIVRRFSFGF